MYVILFVVHLAYFVEIILATDVIPVEIGTSATIPCDHVQNDPEVRLVQWYKSSTIDQFQNGESAVAWWRDGIYGNQLNYQLDSSTFSLTIFNTSLEGEGLYTCFVARGDFHEELHYLTRTVTIAVPRKEPSITVDPMDMNHVLCSVDHVKPLIYPVLNFPGDEAHAVLNEDGTYMTSVGCILPDDRSDARVECSFSYSRFHKSTSLHLRQITTDKPTENRTVLMSTMVISTIPANGYRITVNLTALSISLFVLLLLAVPANFIVLKAYLHRRKAHQDEQENGKVKEHEKMMHLGVV